MLQQMLHVASIPWVGAGSGCRQRWSRGHNGPCVREKRSGRGNRCMRIVVAGRAGPAGVAAAARGQVRQHTRGMAQQQRVGGRATGATCNHAYEWSSKRALQPMDMWNNNGSRGIDGCRIDWSDETKRAGNKCGRPGASEAFFIFLLLPIRLPSFSVFLLISISMIFLFLCSKYRS
jgi:hypothetical protein